MSFLYNPTVKHVQWFLACKICGFLNLHIHGQKGHVELLVSDKVCRCNWWADRHVPAEQFITKYCTRITNAQLKGVNQSQVGLKVALQWFTKDSLHFMNDLLHLLLHFLTFICETKRKNNSILNSGIFLIVKETDLSVLKMQQVSKQQQR